MNPQSAQPGVVPLDAHAVLLVDDEPHMLRWFSRLYGDEFVVFTASGVEPALDLLEQRGQEVAVLLTDYSMPRQDGVTLLSEARQRHPHVSRLLVSAFADKQVAMTAVNQGNVEFILEKPLDEALTRQILRAALSASRARQREQAPMAWREKAQRETLDFLANEVTASLAAVSACLDAMRERQQDEIPAMLGAAARRAGYAQTLVDAFVRLAGQAYPADGSTSLRASDLVRAVRDEYPFDAEESEWLSCDLARDFTLPGRRDLLYLVMCTLVKNALTALRPRPPARPRVSVSLDRASPAPWLSPRAVIRVSDNGPGIAPDVLRRLTRDSVSPPAMSRAGGSELVFCDRVMTLLGGVIEVRSDPVEGATVSLYFPVSEEQLAEEPR